MERDFVKFEYCLRCLSNYSNVNKNNNKIKINKKNREMSSIKITLYLILYLGKKHSNHWELTFKHSITKCLNLKN